MSNSRDEADRAYQARKRRFGLMCSMIGLIGSGLAFLSMGGDLLHSGGRSGLGALCIAWGAYLFFATAATLTA